jgi:hypothetical protein
VPFLLDHLRVESAKEAPGRLVARWGLRCSFLSVRSPTVRALTEDGWRTTFKDKLWTVQTAP